MVLKKNGLIYPAQRKGADMPSVVEARQRKGNTQSVYLKQKQLV